MQMDYFPTGNVIDKTSKDILKIFEKHLKEISSKDNVLSSDEVLEIIRDDLLNIGFEVEKSKKKKDKIIKSVEGKCFCLDAYMESEGYIIEVEAGRAIENYQILRDLFEACVIKDVKYLCVALRENYAHKNQGKDIVSQHYNKAKNLLKAFFSSEIKTQLKGVLLIGY